MELTVVIPCRDDPLIAACVDSIDHPVEVVIVLNGSPPGFRESLRSAIGDRARIEELPIPNLPQALEHGISVAAWDRVILMDSDCTFEPGSLTAIHAAFEQGDPRSEVFKGRITFDRAGRATALVARSREQRQGGAVTAYKPPLAFDRGIANRLDGYFFDPRLPWKEDAALSHRIASAGIRVVPVDGCSIHHAPLSPMHDLRSTFRYGVGAALARHLAIPTTAPQRSLRRALHRHGLDAAAYLALGNAARFVGYWYAVVRIRSSGGRWLERVAGP